MLNHHDIRDDHCGRIGHLLPDKFGGVTAHTRALAEGLWKEGGTETSKDETVTYEVMPRELDEKWWAKYRTRLEKRLKQESVIVRAQDV